jgi:hypothetical protein
MSCQIKNNANLDLTDLQPHIDGMYDHFHQKIGFQKPPVIVFDSDPSNQSKVLGKTAYYDPQSFEVHVYTDGRHPKDMLRSIAHELIHHQQNLEGRLDVGGYNGPGYYLENDKLRDIEEEAMTNSAIFLREYEDGLKLEEKNKMSLKEWKNNELNQLLLKKFGILKEEKDNENELTAGQKKLPKALQDKIKNAKPKSKKDDSDDKPPKGGAPAAAEQEEEKEVQKENFTTGEKGGVADKMAAKYAKDAEKNKKSGKDKPVKQDKESGMYFGGGKEDELEEGRLNPRTTNPDKFVGHEDRYQPDRIHEADEEELDEGQLCEKCGGKHYMKEEEVEETVRRMPSEDYPGNRDGQGTRGQDEKNIRESIRSTLKENRAIRLKIKR